MFNDKELMHDPIFLARKSEVATKEDLQVVQDLLNMLIAHKDSCVGMAANMIGVRKRIIAFLDEGGRAPTYTVMLNPEIIKKTVCITPRRDVFLFSAVLVRVSAINPLSLDIIPWNCKLELRPSLAGRHRSFSTKWIIAMGF